MSPATRRAVAATNGLRVVAGVRPASAEEWAHVHALAQAFCVPGLDLRLVLFGDEAWTEANVRHPNLVMRVVEESAFGVVASACLGESVLDYVVDELDPSPDELKLWTTRSRLYQRRFLR